MLFDYSLYLSVVSYLYVWSDINVLRHEIPIDDRILGHNIFVRHLKVRLHLLLQKISEPLSVFIVDETVAEDPQIFVVPESEQTAQILR